MLRSAAMATTTRKRDRVVGNEAAAEVADMNVNTFRGLVTRGFAPQPIDREVSGGHALPVYDRVELEEYRRSRRRWSPERRGQS